jgi:hypothetical protein
VSTTVPKGISKLVTSAIYVLFTSWKITGPVKIVRVGAKESHVVLLIVSIQSSRCQDTDPLGAHHKGDFRLVTSFHLLSGSPHRFELLAIKRQHCLEGGRRNSLDYMYILPFGNAIAEHDNFGRLGFGIGHEDFDMLDHHGGEVLDDLATTRQSVLVDKQKLYSRSAFLEPDGGLKLVVRAGGGANSDSNGRLDETVPRRRMSDLCRQYTNPSMVD